MSARSNTNERSAVTEQSDKVDQDSQGSDQVSQLTATSFLLDAASAYVPRAEIIRLTPSQNVPVFINGEPETEVSISINRVPFSGGHLHEGGPQGESDRDRIRFQQWPQNEQIHFTAPEFAGTSELILSDSIGRTVRCWLEYGVAGLVELTPRRGIVLCGCSSEHPHTHWGTPELVNLLSELGSEFFSAFGKPLWVNDLSLPCGGRLDCNSDWSHPHRTHSAGRDVDINWKVMSQREREEFARMASAIGFVVELHGPINHWHLHL